MGGDLVLIGIKPDTGAGATASRIKTHYNGTIFEVDRGSIYVANLEFTATQSGLDSSIIIQSNAMSGPSASAVIENCTFRYNISSIDPPAKCIDLISMEYTYDGCRIQNCTFLGCHEPISGDGTWMDIVNNKFYDCSGVAITLNGITNTPPAGYRTICNVENNTLMRNEISDVNSAISLSDFDNISLINNDIIRYTGSTSGSNGIVKLTNINDISIQSNKIIPLSTTSSCHILISTNDSYTLSINSNIFGASSNNVIVECNGQLMTAGTLVGNTYTSATTPSIHATKLVSIGNSWQTETLY